MVKRAACRRGESRSGMRKRNSGSWHQPTVGGIFICDLECSGAVKKYKGLTRSKHIFSKSICFGLSIPTICRAKRKIPDSYPGIVKDWKKLTQEFRHLIGNCISASKRMQYSGKPASVVGSVGHLGSVCTVTHWYHIFRGTKTMLRLLLSEVSPIHTTSNSTPLIRLQLRRVWFLQRFFYFL